MESRHGVDYDIVELGLLHGSKCGQHSVLCPEELPALCVTSRADTPGEQTWRDWKVCAKRRGRDNGVSRFHTAELVGIHFKLWL